MRVFGPLAALVLSWPLAGCGSPNAVANAAAEIKEAVVQPVTATVDSGDYKLDLTLRCPVRGVYLDGSSTGEGGFEKLTIERTQIASTKDGWGPMTTTNFKIVSNNKEYSGNLIASGEAYAIGSYGSLVENGIARDIILVDYMIDLKTGSMKRSTQHFGVQQVAVYNGNCVILRNAVPENPK